MFYGNVTLYNCELLIFEVKFSERGFTLLKQLILCFSENDSPF